MLFKHYFYCLALITLSGCFAAPMSFHINETAEVLKPKQVSITPSGGIIEQFGYDKAPLLGMGALRLRVGVGKKQEIGAEGFGLGRINTLAAYGGKLSWKIAPTSMIATVIHAGVNETRTLASSPDSYFWLSILNSHRVISAGIQHSLIISSPRAFIQLLKPYGGLSYSINTIQASDKRDWKWVGMQYGLNFAGGLSIEPIHWLKITTELGYMINAWAPGGAIADIAGRFYANVGISFIIGR